MLELPAPSNIEGCLNIRYIEIKLESLITIILKQNSKTQVEILAVEANLAYQI